MNLPKFALDGAHRAALVLGRAADLGPLSAETVERCVAIARDHAETTGLPLAFVLAARVEPGEGEVYAGAAAGIVVAHAVEGELAEVTREMLAQADIDAIPTALWSDLEAAGASFPAPSEDDDPESPAEGLFLVPGGWSVASLVTGERDVILTCAAEDTTPAIVVPSAVLEQVDRASKPVRLEASYC
jgi:hypothetical protein